MTSLAFLSDVPRTKWSCGTRAGSNVSHLQVPKQVSCEAVPQSSGLSAPPVPQRSALPPSYLSAAPAPSRRTGWTASSALQTARPGPPCSPVRPRSCGPARLPRRGGRKMSGWRVDGWTDGQVPRRAQPSPGECHDPPSAGTGWRQRGGKKGGRACRGLPWRPCPAAPGRKPGRCPAPRRWPEPPCHWRAWPPRSCRPLRARRAAAIPRRVTCPVSFLPPSCPPSCPPSFPPPPAAAATAAHSPPAPRSCDREPPGAAWAGGSRGGAGH